MKRLILVALLAAAALPTAANAAVPCRDRIYNDWYADGKIASTYPLACYRDALKHVPSRSDLQIYSSLSDDIKSALRAAEARRHGERVAPQVGKGLPGTHGGVLPATAKLTTAKHSTTSKTAQDAGNVSTIATGQTASSGGGIPTPIIVLAVIAILLAATGAVGATLRRQRRG